MSQETDARILIDQWLLEDGWDGEDKGQVSTEETAMDGRTVFILTDSRLREMKCRLDELRQRHILQHQELEKPLPMVLYLVFQGEL
jgi:hypothetical protein